MDWSLLLYKDGQKFKVERISIRIGESGRVDIGSLIGGLHLTLVLMNYWLSGAWCRRQLCGIKDEDKFSGGVLQSPVGITLSAERDAFCMYASLGSSFVLYV